MSDPRIDIQPNIPDPDGFYQAVVSAQEGLDADAALEYMSRLAFLLANQVGDQAVLLECVAIAAAPFKRREA